MPRSGLDEFDHEFVLGLRRVGRILVSGIVRVAQEIPFVHQLESRRLDFLAKKRLFDAMQGTGFGDTGTRSTRMISYNIETPRLERAKDCVVHRRAINAEMSEVVIVEHQGCEIYAFYRELGRNGIFERPGERDDRGGLDAIASEIVFAFGEGDRGWTWRACWRCWRRTRRGNRVAVALGRDRSCGYPVGIARPALTINLAQGSDRTG